MNDSIHPFWIARNHLHYASANTIELLQLSNSPSSMTVTITVIQFSAFKILPKKIFGNEPRMNKLAAAIATKITSPTPFN